MKRLNIIALLTGFLTFLILKGYSQEVEDVLPRWKYINDSKVSLYNHFAEQAFKMLDSRKSKLSKLTSRQGWQQRQTQVRAAYRKILGPFPKKTPLNPVITGVIEKDGIRMEKIYFESLPGYYVTGALYLPANKKGKLPAILFCSGHGISAFRSRSYQPEILNFVKKGFAVFAFDPIGQGERKQYANNEIKKLPSPTQEHSYPGSQLFLTGRSPAYYFIWDGIRAIDYLYSRPEIDTSRVGVTGRSGGGTQTAYIAAFDNRVKAAAPECYITSYEKLLMDSGPQDAEQNFVKGIYNGLDIADLLVCFAPKPLLIVSTTRDQYFSIQGARDVFKEVRRTYSYLGNADYLSMAEDDARHVSTPKNRSALYRFFQKYLVNPGNGEDEEIPVFTDDELKVTKEGSVYASLKGDDLHTLANKRLTEVLSKRTKIAGDEDLKKRIIAVTGFNTKYNAADAIFSGGYQKKNYTVETYLLKAPTVYLPVYWLKPTTKAVKNKAILLLDDRGKSEAIKEGGLADSLALEGYQVVVPDLSGFGELANGYIKGGDSYVDKVPLNLWFMGMLVNESMLGVRLKELSLLLDWMAQSNQEIEGIARGVLTTDLLHIATLRGEPISSLLLIDPLVSYQSVVEQPYYQTKYVLSSVSGMVNQYDLYDLINYVSDKERLILVNPRNGADEVQDAEQIKHVGIRTGKLLSIQY